MNQHPSVGEMIKEVDEDDSLRGFQGEGDFIKLQKRS